MRTSEEIRDLLKSQLWFDRFVYNIHDKEIVDVYDNKTPEEKLNGKLLIDTIEKSFWWLKTKEHCVSGKFWERIDRQFEDWYDAE